MTTKPWLERADEAVSAGGDFPPFTTNDLTHYIQARNTLAFVCADGGFLCADCANLGQVHEAMLEYGEEFSNAVRLGLVPSESEQWLVIGVQVPEPGHGDKCDHCGGPIPPVPAEVCDECGAAVPDVAGGNLANRHHADACSLYDPDKE